ncbi:hypothetical protein [Wolbachia endosymbiont of Oedothorax gibbosus]|uniref:hypothetical protein n=1 Tax=Wolbachia endosymbiont of Oedothorax gibbosus TaxID=931100 RepID=UPI002025181E|nr:hypothetical protein [Wolbachia endosymbiont of Oedothorax gibbosus]
MKVADTGSFMMVSSQSGIQVANKQTSIENGYNVFDEIAGRLDSSVKHWNDTVLDEKAGFQTGICHLQIAIAVSVRVNYEKNSSYKRVIQ